MERLEARVAELEAQLGRHSGNSSKPPSSDTLAQRAQQVASKAKRGSGRRPGKQPGSEGRHLARAEEPDVFIYHAPSLCQSCGEALGDAEVAGVESRQVFDIPEVKVTVTEHISERRRCGCGAVTGAAFPPEATAPTCWGPGVRALGSYLLVRQHLPVGRTAELMSDVLGAPVSTGFLSGLPAEAGQGLEGFLADLGDRLGTEEVLHVDETGARISGQRWWFHTASTKRLTLLGCHRRRGREAVDSIGVLPRFFGVAVHDRWKPYLSYDCRHAFCGAHLLRDLADVSEVASQEPWTGAMAKLLVNAKSRVETALAAGKGGLSHRQYRYIVTRYRRILVAAFAANPDPEPGGSRNPLERASFNLAVAFRDHEGEVLRFAFDPRVPFDNNQAERDLRMVKLQQKISGCFRSPEGAQSFAAVRSYIETGRKHGQNPLGLLTQLFTGNPWSIPSAVASA